MTVIPTGLYEKLSGVSLHPPQRTLRGASQDVLPAKGQFTGRLRREDRTTHQEVYVVDQLHKPLLGRPAIEALGLLARIRSVREETSQAERFPQLFEGLGRMQGEYSNQLKEGAVPFALANKRVRICVDLTKLNENICRERHPLPASGRFPSLLNLPH